MPETQAPNPLDEDDEPPFWQVCIWWIIFASAIAFPFLLSTIALYIWGPLPSIGVAVVYFLFYHQVRPRTSGGFGPMWLTLLDMSILVVSLLHTGIGLFYLSKQLWEYFKYMPTSN